MDVVGSEREEKMTTVTARFTVSPEWFERRERQESDDLRLGDYKIDLVVKNLLARAVETGRLSPDDVKFLMHWDSGTYSQTAPVPVLFPFDRDFSDEAESSRRFRRFRYYDDAAVVYGGMKYRLLELRGERALSVLLNWLKERGFSDSELKLGLCGNGSLGADTTRNLGLGKASLTSKAEKREKPVKKLLSKKRAAEAMREVDRLVTGAVPASKVKTAFNMQLRRCGYTPSTFAAGVGLPKAFVLKWCKGQLVIRPDEMRKICKHLGVANLFEKLPSDIVRR